MRLDPIDPSAAEPPFEQLRRQIAARASGGELPAGTRLPTVRALAAEVGLAVNTVARVYRELEADGVVVTEGRRGTFVSPTRRGGRHATCRRPRRRTSRPCGGPASASPRRSGWSRTTGRAETAVHSPVKLGERFSPKAATASRKSALPSSSD